MTVQWFNDVWGEDWYYIKQAQERDGYHREADGAYVAATLDDAHADSFFLYIDEIFFA